jgi:hypothetical protein
MESDKEIGRSRERQNEKNMRYKRQKELWTDGDINRTVYIL